MGWQGRARVRVGFVDRVTGYWVKARVWVGKAGVRSRVADSRPLY